ncbi:low-density lipoprotein receptor-related protein 4-like isoform X4 [Daphnia pulicaria]|uniref:low-density lipoprotein receptor-related protein 4-like isoform X4 n=1 Tax=Daphnia pulicaria TaxID=35523 RepID=UPI001EEA996A|nr:low-density lipoprotein receptor-related protein 4-like isoform X4 [Daphnia pulicaria]
MSVWSSVSVSRVIPMAGGLMLLLPLLLLLCHSTGCANLTPDPSEPSRPVLKTARLNVNQTRLATTTTTTTTLSPAGAKTTQTLNSGGGGMKIASKPDCKCRPEEFTCSSSSTGSAAGTNNSRRKGQLSFTVKQQQQKTLNGTANGQKSTNVLAVQQQQGCVCIPLSWVCDGNQDCDRGQDESDCGETVCHGIRCRSGSAGHPTPRCIQPDWLCDGDDDCGDNSDEIHCEASRNCTASSFRCPNNGNCIPQVWVCDGDPDCDGGADERDCSVLLTRTCPPSQHRCGNGACLPAEWRCDGDPDCSDMSDETGCQQSGDGGADGAVDRDCGADEFQCASGHCIKGAYRCDGEIHCRDVSDELDCGSLLPRCVEGDFRCPDGQCIAQAWRCDGEQDCEPGVDEENCDSSTVAGGAAHTCGPNQMACSSSTGKNGPCISTSWVCDGETDCPDGQDEQNCPANHCGKDQFSCSNDTCVGFSRVCNGERDCPGGEDEFDCTIQKECDAGSRCQHTCLVLSNGTGACGCRSGFRLTSDGVNCVDVDECATETYCSQLCTNTVGGFSCSCVDGYVLRPDKSSCKALGQPVRLIFANRVDIRQVSLFEEEYTSVIDGLQNAIALDFHYKKGLVIWSDVTLDAIKRAHLNGTAMPDAVWWGLKSPGGVAVDWIHDNLYWTDSGVRRIEVSLLDGTMRRTLVWENVEKPRAIAVHPGAAAVIWTDWGHQPRIERSDMDGSNRQILVTENLVWPNGLTIDYTVDHIYWADAKHHVIESVRLDGTGRRRVMERGLPHPFAITIFEDSLFWTDWHTKSIHQANKLTGHDIRTVRTNLHFPMDIHSIHPLRQPEYVNRCGSNRGGCSHLCLPNRSSYTCACPPGLQLITPNGRTCTSQPGELLIFAQKSELRLFPLNVSGEVDHVLPLTGVRSAVALDWDGASQTIFWTDVESDVINRAFWNGSNQQTLVANDLESPAGLAVDWVTKKLYWTDAGTNRIEVSNLDGTLRSLLIWDGLDRPRDIVVDPIGGYMYWTDWGQTPKIERAGMDGSQRSVIVISNLTWPNGLAIDHEGERLYWADGGTKAIEYASLDGKNRTVLIGAELPHPFGLALYENQIFWSDWDTAAIHSTDKLNAKRRTMIRSGLDDLMDVRVYHSNRYSVPSLCQSHNGGCSHLCLLAPLPAGHSCACPTGIKLSADRRTCRQSPSTSLIFSQRSNLRRMSLDMPYLIDVVLDLPPQKNVVALDVDRVTGHLLWSDTTQDKIFRALPGSPLSAPAVEVIAFNLDTVEGLAVDEINRKLYWTDAGRSSLEVAELEDGGHRKVLIWTLMDKPRGLVLSHSTGTLFWADWGKQPRIEQADMDGRNRKVMVSTDLGWPNSLTIDYAANMLYWTDARKKTIESCDLSGLHRREVLTGLSHPYGITVLDSYLYWTDWETKSLQRADKNTALDRSTIRVGLDNLMDIKAWKEMDASSHRENPCGTNNGGCSHLCLRSPWGRGYSCSCPTGILMSADGSTCQPSPNSFLLYATRNTLSSISLDTADQWDVALNVPGVHNAIGVDFHWGRQRFYYTDVYLDVIRSVDARNVSNVETLVSSNLTTPDGLAVDWLADNLYWTDAGRNVLEASRLDGTNRKIIIGSGLDEPRAVAVFPQRGLLYWTDWGQSHKIERSFLDGSHRVAIVTSELGWPNGLAIDYEGQRLYWADAQLDRIETSDLSGRFRVQLVQGATHPFGLTQLGGFLYWTDWRSKSIERVDKATGKQRSVLRHGLEGLMEIRAVAREKQLGKNPCSTANGGCTHLCLFRAISYVCACPDIPDDIPCTSSVVNISASDDYWSPALDPFENDLEPTSDVYPHNPYRLDPSAGAGVLHPSMIVLLVVGMAALLAAMAVLLIKWQRRRYRDCPWNSSRGPRQPQQVSVLTFTNPNYSPSAPDVVVAEKKGFSWQRWKYDRTQERVYDMQDEKQSQTEAASLIPHSQPPPEVETDLEAETDVIESSSGPSSTPPPTPPQRMDSICLQ